MLCSRCHWQMLPSSCSGEISRSYNQAPYLIYVTQKLSSCYGQLNSYCSWLLSNPVFTSLLAWIFLKERCTILDCVFTVFTLTGVILIARPPFIFGDHLHGIEGNYSNHIKGTIAAFAGNDSFPVWWVLYVNTRSGD